MSKRIFISTHNGIAGKVYGNDRTGKFGLLKSMFVDVNKIEIIPFSNGDILYYSSNGLFISQQTDTSIILIIDSIAEDNLRHFQISDKDYLLHHHTINEKVKKLFGANKRVEGTHSAEEGQFYKPMFDILLNSQIEFTNKPDKIIDSIFNTKKEQKAERTKAVYLKSIWDGNKPQQIECPDIIAQINGISELINYFNEKPYNEELDRKGISPESEEQKFRLKLLREAILKSK